MIIRQRISCIPALPWLCFVGRCSVMMTSSNENIFRVTGHLCGEFPAQRPVTRSFDSFFDLRLNEPLRKQSWGRWFVTLSRPLLRHSNEWTYLIYNKSLALFLQLVLVHQMLFPKSFLAVYIPCKLANRFDVICVVVLCWTFYELMYQFNPLRAKSFTKIINMCLQCLSFLHTDMTHVLKSFLTGDEDLPILHRQCHGCWWPGKAMSQGISNQATPRTLTADLKPSALLHLASKSVTQPWEILVN